MIIVASEGGQVGGASELPCKSIRGERPAHSSTALTSLENIHPFSNPLIFFAIMMMVLGRVRGRRERREGRVILLVGEAPVSRVSVGGREG